LLPRHNSEFAALEFCLANLQRPYKHRHDRGACSKGQANSGTCARITQDHGHEWRAGVDIQEATMNPMAVLCYLVAAIMALATGYVAYTRPPFPSDSFIIILGIITILVVLGYLLRRRR